MVLIVVFFTPDFPRQTTGKTDNQGFVNLGITGNIVKVVREYSLENNTSAINGTTASEANANTAVRRTQM